jgi:cell division cycle protein 20 (cofactor of APC complex)
MVLHLLQADRFIPNRKAMDFDMAAMSRQRSTESCDGGSNEENEGFKNALASSLLNHGGSANSSSEESNQRVLAFKEKAPTPCDGYQNNLRVLYSQNRGITQRAKSVRHIPSGPERVLGK